MHNRSEDWTVFFLNPSYAPASGIATAVANSEPVECLVERVKGGVHDPGSSSPSLTTMWVNVRVVSPTVKIVASPVIVSVDGATQAHHRRNSSSVPTMVENADVEGEDTLALFDETESEKLDYKMEDELCVSFAYEEGRIRLIFETKKREREIRRCPRESHGQRDPLALLLLPQSRLQPI